MSGTSYNHSGSDASHRTTSCTTNAPFGNRSQPSNRAQFNYTDVETPIGNPACQSNDPSSDDEDGGINCLARGGRQYLGQNEQSATEDRHPLRPNGVLGPSIDKDSGGTSDSSSLLEALRSYRVHIKPPLKSETHLFRNQECERYKTFALKNQFKGRQDHSESLRSISRDVSIAASNLSKPDFPRVDLTVSEEKISAKYGADRYIYSGSPHHWTRDSRYTKGNSRKIRFMFASFNADSLKAETWYDSCFLSRGDEQHQNEQGFSDSNSSADSSYSDFEDTGKDVQISSNVARRTDLSKPAEEVPIINTRQMPS